MTHNKYKLQSYEMHALFVVLLHTWILLHHGPATISKSSYSHTQNQLVAGWVASWIIMQLAEILHIKLEPSRDIIIFIIHSLQES